MFQHNQEANRAALFCCSAKARQALCRFYYETEFIAAERDEAGSASSRVGIWQKAGCINCVLRSQKYNE